jgi:hypothetical protein
VSRAGGFLLFPRGRKPLVQKKIVKSSREHLFHFLFKQQQNKKKYKNILLEIKWANWTQIVYKIR